MKKALFVLGALFLFVSVATADSYYAGDNVTELAIARDFHDAAYVCFVQNGNLKMLAEPDDSDSYLVDLITYEEPFSAVKGLCKCETMYPVFACVGEKNGSSYIYTVKFPLNSEMEQQINQIPMVFREVSKPSLIYNYSKYYNTYLFIADGTLYNTILDDEIKGIEKISSSGEYVVDYSIIMCGNGTVCGWYRTDNSIFMFDIDNGVSYVQNRMTFSGSDISFFESDSGDVYIRACDSYRTVYLKYDSSWFNLISEAGNVTYPLLEYNNEASNAKVFKEDGMFVIYDNYQTVLDAEDTLLFAVDREHIELLCKDNKGWSIKRSDFVTTENGSSYIGTGTFLNVVFYEQPCFVFGEDEGTLIFADINDLTSQKTLTIDFGGKELSSLTCTAGDMSLVFCDGSESFWLLNLSSGAVSKTEGTLFDFSTIMNDCISCVGYSDGLITVKNVR